jgi:type IV secretion system protein VirB11
MRGETTLRFLMQPIADDLAHPGTTDLIINRPHEVAVRQNGQWLWRDVPEFDFETLDAMTILIGQRMGREFDEGHPYVNSTLPDGQRFQGVRPPGTMNGHFLWAVRRPPAKARAIDDPDFDDDGLFQTTNRAVSRARRAKTDVSGHLRRREWRELFRAARLGGLSIAFCGSMGSGKTDLIRRMIQIYRPDVRIGMLETDPETGAAGPRNKAPLLYDDTQMSADEAVRILKRLAPDEVFMQEVRGAEAYSLLVAMNSGLPGCTTWHADEGHEIEALAAMALMHPSGRDMGEGRLMDMARHAFDLIAYCVRDSDNNRWQVNSVRLMSDENAETV